MSKKLIWDQVGEKYYETGVDRVVLYVQNNAEAWSGITAINESPSGAEATKIYADNIVYGVMLSPEETSLTIEAFTYPELFNKCIGRNELALGAYVNQQNRRPFGLCWRTRVGNDVNGLDNYKLHIVPRLFAASSEDSNSTINDSPEQKTFSWSSTAVSVPIDEDRYASSLVLDSRKFKNAGLWNAITSIENYLYGTDKANAKIPTAAEILSIIAAAGVLLDSTGRDVLDSEGNKILTAVY